MALKDYKYIVPSIEPDATVEVAPVSLDDFSIDQIREYLRHHGDLVAASHDDDADSGNTAGGLFVSPADLNRIETLVLCGQRDSAREALCSLASEVIGRPL